MIDENILIETLKKFRKETYFVMKWKTRQNKKSDINQIIGGIGLV